MATSAKTLSAVGLAFVAGVSAIAFLTPGKAPLAMDPATATASPQPGKAMRGSDVPKVQASREWTDPVRTKAVAAAPSPATASAGGDVASVPDAMAVEGAGDPVLVPTPPARPTDEALEAESGRRKVTRTRTASARQSPYPHQASRASDRRYAPLLDESGYRTASYPGRDYAYADDGAYGQDAYAPQRVEIDRRPSRRSQDGLMRWLSESGPRY